jgi:hypothetical protein
MQKKPQVLVAEPPHLHICFEMPIVKIHHTAHTWYVSAVAGFDGSASMNRPVGEVHSRHMLLMGCQASMPGAAQGSVNSGWIADLQHSKHLHVG